MKPLLIILTLFFSFTALSQTEEPIEITWEDLADVEYEEIYLDTLDAWYFKPLFSDKLKSLEGKAVRITGLIVDLDYEYSLLTNTPERRARCFFGGKYRRPEFIELKGWQPNRCDIANDKPVGISGVLQLNSDDIYSCNFILENAELVSD